MRCLAGAGEKRQATRVVPAGRGGAIAFSLPPVDFVVRPWVKIDDYWDVYWDVTKTVKLRFDDEGISIPFPQRDVHLYNNSVDTAGPVEHKGEIA